MDELRLMGRVMRSKVFCCVCGSRYGNLLGPVYLITKVFYLINVYGQLFMLDAFLGPKYHAYGIEVITAVINGQDWTNSRRFPTITLCDFPVRSLGNLQRYTVQCVLSINLFNERIYLCIWFMLLSIAIITTINALLWAWRLCFRFNRINYIVKHLKLTATITSESNPSEKKLIAQFVDQYLRHDGAFIFKLLAHNTNSLIISELITEVWKTFLRTLKKECIKYKCSEHAPLTATSATSNLNSFVMDSCCSSPKHHQLDISMPVPMTLTQPVEPPSLNLVSIEHESLPLYETETSLKMSKLRHETFPENLHHT